MGFFLYLFDNIIINVRKKEFNMNVLMINGSPRVGSNTSIALDTVKQILIDNNIEVNEFDVIGKDIPGCRACGACYKLGKCAIDDCVNELAKLFEKADGVIVASPVYYASANGTLISLLDRLFYSTNFDKRFKVGASIAIARRGGIETTFDQLNKYFTISGMPLVSSSYWNGVYGRKVGEANQDKEGLQTMKNLAINMVFMLKAIDLAKKEYGIPEKISGSFTNFIR